MRPIVVIIVSRRSNYATSFVRGLRHLSSLNQKYLGHKRSICQEIIHGLDLTAVGIIHTAPSCLIGFGMASFASCSIKQTLLLSGQVFSVEETFPCRWCCWVLVWPCCYGPLNDPLIGGVGILQFLNSNLFFPGFQASSALMFVEMSWARNLL